MFKITGLVLTFNESVHIKRCIRSLVEVCEDIVVIDSYSNDDTASKAQSWKQVRFFENEWVNHSAQVNWALNNCGIQTEWVLRLDADEIISEELICELNALKQSGIAPDVNGILINRKIHFHGKDLLWGGMYPIAQLRMWRHNMAFCENKWMDERMRIKEGRCQEVSGDIVDRNLNSLKWWIDKHSSYAVKEAFDFYIQLFDWDKAMTTSASALGLKPKLRRQLKQVFLRLPPFCRPIILFVFRYFIQLGFLDGRQGFIWAFFQGLWYRMLVDTHIWAVRMHCNSNEDAIRDYFARVYHLRIDNED